MEQANICHHWWGAFSISLANLIKSSKPSRHHFTSWFIGNVWINLPIFVQCNVCDLINVQCAPKSTEVLNMSRD